MGSNFCIKIFLFGLFFFISSCRTENENEIEVEDKLMKSDSEVPDPIWRLKEELKTVLTLNFKEVKYQAKFLPALEFLKRKGENIDSRDINDLKSESVVLLEFSSLKQSSTDVLKLKQCTKEYEKAIEYLAFGIEQDIHIEQSGKKFLPTGVLFEREFNLTNKKRILCYFKGIDSKADFKLVFNDQVLSAGILKFNFEHKSYLEK